MFCCYSSAGTPDKVNLNDIDSEAIFLKDDRTTRKHQDYKTLRRLAREGLSKNDRRLAWIKATNASDKDMIAYKKLNKTLFEGIEMHEFPQFPMFGSKCRFKALSTQQKYCVRKILVVLAVEHDSLHYCPQIPFVVVESNKKKNIYIHICVYVYNFVCCREYCFVKSKKSKMKETIIQHVEEATAFAIMNAMVKVSKQNDWYFRTDFFNFRVRLRTFMDVFADNVKLLFYLRYILFGRNIAVEKIIADGFATMYANYLNPEALLRLIDTFTVEGYKVLFRVGLALL
ncbi:rabGTPase-activating protein, partial [Reticulomyxa filosa]